MGLGAIRGVLEFWRKVEALGKKKLTTDMARKTFCTLGAKYAGDQKRKLPVHFKLPDQQLMDVTHHRSHDQFQSYVVNASWRDPEAEAHAARTFSLWAQDEYKPPVTACMPDALGRINENQESGFKNLNRTQASISVYTATHNITQLILHYTADPPGAQEHPSRQVWLSCKFGGVCLST